MHKCDCHGRPFGTLRGLKQHLAYTSKVSSDQSVVCSEVLNDSEVTTAPKFTSRASIEVLNNEWVKQSDDTDHTSCQGDDDENFNDYVIQHLHSLTDFTRSLYLRIEKMEQDRIHTHEQYSLVDELLAKVEILQSELAAKDRIIHGMSKQEFQNQPENRAHEWETVRRASFKRSLDTSNKSKIPKISGAQLPVLNRFESLKFHSNENECLDDCMFTDSNVSAEYEYHQRRKDKYPVKQSIFTEKTPENNTILSWRNKTSIVPGVNKYSEIVKKEKKLAIFGDSLCKRLLGSKLNPKLQNCKTFIRPFVGADTDELSYHITPTLNRGELNGTLLLIGTNNLTANSKAGQSTEELCNDIIQVGRKCRESGVENIFISSLPIRKHYVEKVRSINTLLEKLCHKGGFIFICNKNINLDHLYDGLHLNNDGLEILSSNFVNAINGFYNP